jgi:hypothetical protein
LNRKRESDILVSRERIEEIEVLENEAELFATEFVEFFAFEGRDVVAVDVDVAGGNAVDG